MLGRDPALRARAACSRTDAATRARVAKTTGVAANAEAARTATAEAARTATAEATDTAAAEATGGAAAEAAGVGPCLEGPVAAADEASAVDEANERREHPARASIENFHLDVSSIDQSA
jgi:hypothetical protein